MLKVQAVPAVFCLLIALLLGGPAVHAQPAAAAEVDHRAVDEAVQKAKDWLYSKQNAQGTWETAPEPLAPASVDSLSRAAQGAQIGQWGGTTALVVYALLSSGEDANDPRLARAIQFLKNAELTGTYAVGLRLMALKHLPMDAQGRRIVQRDAQLLLQSVKTQGNASGHWDYNVLVRPSPTIFSHSRSQYGILGLWAAAHMGAEVDPRIWQLADEGWRRNQRPGGGWSYTAVASGREAEETPGMTAAGVASLLITNEFLLGDRAVGCNGNLVDQNLEAGLNWLAANFEGFDPSDPARATWAYTVLYHLERLAATGGLRYIGEHDWYARGAAWLLQTQRRDGSWRRRSSGGAAGEQMDVSDTSFALLFLGRGRSPLLAAKLAHVSTDRRGNPRRPDWHQRPRDLANLAEYTGAGLERELHWQILTADRPVEEWLDAPIVYLAGSDALGLSDDVKQRLRDYALKGGLLVFNADCGRQPFTGSVNALARELFPDYSFRVLEQDHAIMSMQYPLGRGRRVPRVQVLGNGARELMILVPSNDVGREWQARRDETALQLGANIYMYAIDRTGMRFKGDRHTVERRAERTPQHNVSLGRIRYEGNWDPEPAGWERLAAVMHNEYDVALEVRPVDPASQELEGFEVLHLTGTGDFQLSDAAREKLAAFVEAGGTLLVDAAGGNAAFATAAERELRFIAGEAANALTEPLGGNHPLFADRRGIPPFRLAWRLDAEMRLGAPREPRVRGIEREGKLSVVWSPEDLSVGLVGMPVADIIGYAPETATAIVARVIAQQAE